MKIRLRAYRPEDFETLHRIDQACYAAEIAYSRADLRAYLGFGTSECVVAELANNGESNRDRDQADVNRDSDMTIVGFCISASNLKEGYIITMDVLGEYRRRGIATALLDETEKRLAAKGVRRVSLETAIDNQAGVAFWKRHGYRTRRIRKGYYPGGRDAYAMTKTLADR